MSSHRHSESAARGSGFAPDLVDKLAFRRRAVLDVLSVFNVLPVLCIGGGAGREDAEDVEDVEDVGDGDAPPAS